MTPEMRRHLGQLLDTIDAAEQIRLRAAQSAIADALACTWTRRANALELALPRPGDYSGGPLDWESGQPLEPCPDDQDRVELLRETVFACRTQAALLEARWLDE